MRPYLHRPPRPHLGPPPWDEVGAGEGEGRTHRSPGCCSPERARARLPAAAVPAWLLPTPVAAPRLLPSPFPPPKAKIRMALVCTSLDSGCSFAPVERPPEGTRRLGFRGPRPQKLLSPGSKISGFTAEQAGMKAGHSKSHILGRATGTGFESCPSPLET